MNADALNIIRIAWIVFVGYWLISALAAKRIARSEGRGGLLLRVFTLTFAGVLLFNPTAPWLGSLTARFVPPALSIEWLGAALTVAGLGFAIWARVYLGRYWSASVALKGEHKLIRRGPYARVRHPIYTGMLLAIGGTALAMGRFAGLLAFVMYAVSFWYKARKEEVLLAGEFGPAFEEHRRSTGFFLPRLNQR
jgi:protein-S-isoprenylcysteine O-methyltransferase Ste14